MPKRYCIGTIDETITGTFDMLPWTTELPTKDGFYWLSWGDDAEIVRMKRETYPNGKTFTNVYTTDAGRGNEEPEAVEYYSKLGCRWLGPIPPPELLNE